MSIFSRSNSLSQYLMKTQTSSRDQHLGSCPRPPGSWVLSWSESRGEGERGLPAPVPPPRGLKGLGYRHKNSGEKGSGGWGGGAPVPLSEIGGTFMPVKVKVKLVSVHFLYTNSNCMAISINLMNFDVKNRWLIKIFIIVNSPCSWSSPSCSAMGSTLLLSLGFLADWLLLFWLLLDSADVLAVTAATWAAAWADRAEARRWAISWGDLPWLSPDVRNWSRSGGCCLR